MIQRILPAANDNDKPLRAAIVSELRAQGRTFRDIADILDISVFTAHRAINPRTPPRKPLEADDTKVIRRVAYNGGWSTNSGMVRVSLPRIPTLHGEVAA